MMRHVFTAFFLLCVCSPLLADTSDTIKPGVGLAAAKATLQKFGYDADTEKYRLAMVARDRNHGLAFCPLDEAITLVMEYQESTKKLVSVGVVIIPEHTPKAQRMQYDRNVLEVKFEDGGVYWLKFQRSAKQRKEN